MSGAQLWVCGVMWDGESVLLHFAHVVHRRDTCMWVSMCCHKSVTNCTDERLCLVMLTVFEICGEVFIVNLYGRYLNDVYLLGVLWES